MLPCTCLDAYITKVEKGSSTICTRVSDYYHFGLSFLGRRFCAMCEKGRAVSLIACFALLLLFYTESSHAEDGCPPVILCNFTYDLRLLTFQHPARDGYLYQALYTWMKSDAGNSTHSVHIFPGSPDISHISKLVGHPGIFVYPFDSSIRYKLPKDKRHVYRLSVYNYHRALAEPLPPDIPPNNHTYELVPDPSRPCNCLAQGIPPGRFVVEDDVIFAEHFMERTIETLLAIRRDLPLEIPRRGQYIVSMYKMRMRRQANETRKIPKKVYNTYKRFCCTQAIFYPTSSVYRLAQDLSSRVWRRREKPLPIDNYLSAFSKPGTLNIYHTEYSVVQHIGNRVSTSTSAPHSDEFFKITN